MANFFDAVKAIADGHYARRPSYPEGTYASRLCFHVYWDDYDATDWEIKEASEKERYWHLHPRLYCKHITEKVSSKELE